MSFGKDLKKCFQTLAVSSRVYEEQELFTKLEDAFILLGSAYYGKYNIKVIHGWRSQVVFKTTKRWVHGTVIGTDKQVELGDMAFCVYSEKNKLCRVFILQSKVKSEEGRRDRFKADLYQLDLLHSRTDFKLIGSMTDNHLLKDSKEKSVALYNIFYPSGTTYEMDTCIAERIVPLSSTGKGKIRTVVYGPYATPVTIISSNDIEATIGIEAFGDQLQEGNIGRILKVTDINLLESICGLENIPEAVKMIFEKLQDDEGISSNSNDKTHYIPFKSIVYIDIDSCQG